MNDPHAQNLTTVSPNNSQSTQPVWVKTSILNERFPTYLDSCDDDCTISSVSTVDTSSSRRFLSSANKSTSVHNRATNRDSTGWGWVFGHANLPTNCNSKGGQTSAFGLTLRKTSRSVYNKFTDSDSFLDLQPRTVTIQDKYNTTYNGVTITLSHEEVSNNMLLANIYKDESGPPKNLIDLTHLHEPTLVHSLQERYDVDKVYTFCGNILLALNPFREMKELYDEHRIKKYCDIGDNDISMLEPHVYSIAHEAYRDMKRSFAEIQDTTLQKKTSDIVVDQSILVSGESGSGKTVTTKFVMKYLAALSQQSVRSSCSNILSSNSMEQQVLQSNPILESFGNARTIRNDNSSRFGKFIEIQFGVDGCLLGASIKTYLLEKVRLISQCEGERNFHIFYELLNGLKQREKDREILGLLGFSLDDFRITAISRTFSRRDSVKDVDTFQCLRSAMKTVGMSSNEQVEIFQVASGLLHFSNLSFIEAQTDSSTLDTSNKSLDFVLMLFGMHFDCLNQALTTHTIDVSKATIKKHLSIEKAQITMEGLMKAIYGALFNYIVKRINQSIRVESTGGEESRYAKSGHGKAFIKILDIFGFESFTLNSFEQLCINYCNEALQQQFNKFVFKIEQEEYRKENIEWSFISWPDNQDVLDLIHTGLFSILDDQAKLVKCTDQSFANALYQKCSDDPRFYADRRQKASGLFSIKHYAGPVEYCSTSFLDKNKDELPKQLTDILLSSSIKILEELGKLLSANKPPNGGRKLQRLSSSISRATVGSQFVAQLSELRKTIDKTSPHYIRCLKPNDDLTPNNFVPAAIADQLRCGGVLEAVRVARVGYPQRYTKEQFIDRYSMLGMKEIDKAKQYKNQELCQALVDSIVSQIWERQQIKYRNSDHIHPSRQKWEKTSRDHVSIGIQLGKTKVFLRHFAFDSLEYLRSTKLDSTAIKIQSIIRMFRHKALYKYVQHCTLVIQSCYRRYLSQKKIRMQKQNEAAIAIQKMWRGYNEYSNFSLVLFVTSWCQRMHRGNMDRFRYIYIRRHKSAVIIQSRWRRLVEERNYIRIERLVINLQQLYRAKKARKSLKNLKAEARDLSRVMNERDELKRASEDLKLQLTEARKIIHEATMDAEPKTKKSIDKIGYDKLRVSVNSNTTNTEFVDTIQGSGDTFDKNVVDLLKLNHCLEDEVKRLKEEIRSLRSIEESSQRKEQEIMELKSIISQMKSDNTSHRSGDNLNNEILSTNLIDSEKKYNPDWQGSTCTSPTLDSISRDDQMMRSGNFDTPIHTALRTDNEDALSLAVSSSEDVVADINRGGFDGKTPLHIAVLHNNISSAELLLENQSVSNAQDHDGNTPLHYATCQFITDLLLKYNANPNIPNSIGIRPLHTAVQRRDLDSVIYLLDNNAYVQVADDESWMTPLHMVMKEESYNAKDHTQKINESTTVQIAKLLCNAVGTCKADINYQDRNGNTPLHFASILANQDAGDLITLLLRQGANPNMKNLRGQAAIHLLLHNEELRSFTIYHELVHLMLHFGSDPNLKSNSGATPLHLAVYHQDYFSATELVSKGAQLHLLWTKPTRWKAYWSDDSLIEVTCLDMIEDQHIMYRILSSISCTQIKSPVRSKCMLCKKKIGTFSRQYHCNHCGSHICGQCSTNYCQEESYFPQRLENRSSEILTVCKICQDILISRKHEQSIMGREVYAIHNQQEEISFLDIDTSFQAQNSDI